MTVRAMHQAGPTPYYFGGVGYMDLQNNPVFDRTARAGRILGRARMHNSKNFKFSPNQQDITGESAQLMVWHVDVASSANINIGAIPSLPVSRNGGPDIVVTTLLNGCTFACEPTANAVNMAHIQPTGGATAASLETDVLNNGSVGGGGVPATNVFGGERCYTAASNDVTIIGVRNGAQWQIYAQIHPRNQRTISRVVELFSG